MLGECCGVQVYSMPLVEAMDWIGWGLKPPPYLGFAQNLTKFLVMPPTPSNTLSPQLV